MKSIIPLAALGLLAGCSMLNRGGSSESGSPSAAAPASFVRSTAETQTTRTVDVRDGLTHAQSMKLLTDVLSARYTVEVTDPRAGFVMTAWQASVRDGVPDLRYRTRVTARFAEGWKRLQLRHEANWQRGDEWEVGFDQPQLDSVAGDLRLKLGRRP